VLGITSAKLAAAITPKERTEERMEETTAA
jgi:hypothetical protein